MNAEEARKLSIENAASQIEEIKKDIEAAVKDGQTTFAGLYTLKAGTIQWLEQNGYKIVTSGNGVCVIQW